MSQTNPSDVWTGIKTNLELQVSKAVFHTFISCLNLVSLNEETAILECSQPMLTGLIEKRYSVLIESAFADRLNKQITLKFIAGKSGNTLKNPGPLFEKYNDTLAFQKPKTREYNLNPDYIFDNFAVSSSNQMAYAAATAVSQSPGESYNPLFLYGGTGVGKTHLMQAAAHEIIKNKPEAKIIYCTGEEFTNEIIEAISGKRTANFKKRYRKANVLLIDDIQFIAGKMAVQEEFFHTFNAIHQVKGQIILTSDRPPEEINKLEERLRSRFEGGLTIDIGQPDFELRCAILMIKAKRRKVDLPLDYIKLMAANIKNPRKLDGVFIRILTESLTLGAPIDETMIKKILGKSANETITKKIDPSVALTAVAKHYNLKTSQLISPKRDRFLSRPRQILYYILRKELHMPFMDIGEFLGGRDHTTILHGVRKITSEVENNKEINGDIMGIKQSLFG